MSCAKPSLIAFITIALFAGAAQVSAKDLGNGWTEDDFKKHYIGCLKGAVSTTLKQLVEKGKITKQTSEEDRKAMVGKLIEAYSPVCKCVQNNIVKKVNIKDIKKVQKDKKFISNISQSCVKKHLK